MNFCPRCGTQLSEDTNFCPTCGNPVNAAPQPEKKKKSGGKSLLIVLTAIVLVAAIVLGVALGTSGWIDSNRNDERTSSRSDRDDEDEDDDRDAKAEAPVPTEAPRADAPAAPATEAPAAETPLALGEPVELDIIVPQYTSYSADWWDTFEEDFESTYRYIDLNIDVVSWNDIYTVVNTRIANGKAPDILNIDAFQDYQADGLLLPAQEYISPKTYAKFYPQFLEQSVIDGTVWAVPDLAFSHALYYNKDILDAVGVEGPTTWTELRTACEVIKAGYPEVIPWGVDMASESHACFAYYTWNNGGGFVDKKGNWDLNSPENVEAITFITDMVKDGLTNADPLSEDQYLLQDMFVAGEVAMMIAHNWLSEYADACGINCGIAPIPTNTGISATVAVMDRFLCFDNGYSRGELAAVTAFFDFFYEDERYVDWILQEGFLPATMTGGELMGEVDPAQALWTEILAAARFYPVEKAEWADMKYYLTDILSNILGGSDVKKQLDILQDAVAG